MKKVIRPYMPLLTLLVGFLTGLGMVCYSIVDYHRIVSDTIQQSIPSGGSILRWLITT